MSVEIQARKWLDTEGLAGRLGVSASTVRQWHRRGMGPTQFRIGGRVRYLVSDVETWEAAQRVPPQQRG